jgi:hypothetical protein
VSKVEAQRAMRDARYAAYQAKLAAEAAAAAEGSAGGRAVQPKKREPEATEPPGPAIAPVPDDAAAAGAGAADDGDLAADLKLCGHRNIGSKTCVRPAGHPEKNHRYK